MIAKEPFLNHKRLRYALLAGGVMWIGWLISLIFGSGKLDLAGQVVGTDYVQFYAAGKTIRMGESTHLYDFDYQHQLEEKIKLRYLEYFKSNSVMVKLAVVRCQISPQAFSVGIKLVSYLCRHKLWSE
jgi:hypothetical protein